MSANRVFGIAGGLLAALTVGLALTVIGLLLAAIWGNPDLSEQMVATAFLLVFTGVATGGAAAFLLVAALDGA